MFGPRALQVDRDDASSQFALVVGGADRGLLIQTVREYYYGEGSTAAVQFVTGRLYDFLEDTKWEAPWNVSRHDPVYYTLDLPNRAKQMTAPRATWPMLIREKIVKALPRLAPFDTLQLYWKKCRLSRKSSSGSLWRLAVCRASRRKLSEAGLCQHQ
eukprot:6991973-Prymnesium_polylepis.1